jgi:hypothetical protein
MNIYRQIIITEITIAIISGIASEQISQKHEESLYVAMILVAVSPAIWLVMLLEQMLSHCQEKACLGLMKFLIMKK